MPSMRRGIIKENHLCDLLLKSDFALTFGIIMCNCSEPSKISYIRREMLAVLRLMYEILFGGYATPTKCEAFWRLVLNSYHHII